MLENISVIARSEADIDTSVNVFGVELASSARPDEGHEGFEITPNTDLALTVEVVNNSAGVILGDINGDSVVDLLDVNPFIQLLLDSEFNAAGDFNGDGVLDLLDINGFVDAIISGGGGDGGAGAEFVIEILSN